MTALAEAVRWTCDGCGVAVGRMDRKRVPLPESWEKTGEGAFCLTCRRARAAEAALGAVEETSSAADRAKARRAGLIEFEIRRTPDLNDATIAKACRTIAPTVTAARTRLQKRKVLAPRR
jgi:hypothetical protein